MNDNDRIRKEQGERLHADAAMVTGKLGATEHQRIVEDLIPQVEQHLLGVSPLISTPDVRGIVVIGALMHTAMVVARVIGMPRDAFDRRVSHWADKIWAERAIPRSLIQALKP